MDGKHARDRAVAGDIAPRRPCYVNLWARPQGGGESVQAEAHGGLDQAAEDAVGPSLYRYAGTVRVVGGATPQWLDLTAHGLALSREDAAHAADEAALARALGQGAGRTVL